MTEYEWSGFGQTMRMLYGLEHPDPRPMLEKLEKVIAGDNLRGNLRGEDKDGIPYARVTYRPVVDKPKKVTKRQRNNARAARKGQRGIFAGLGPHAAGLHNNLTPAEYRKLGGEPLSPRGPYSRINTNLFTGHGEDGPGEYYAVGEWRDVVSVDGKEILPAHFNGENVGRGHKTKLPKRDARGVRPEGMQEAVAETDRWASSLLTETA
jgi:hypothetical protein